MSKSHQQHRRKHSASEAAHAATEMRVDLAHLVQKQSSATIEAQGPGGGTTVDATATVGQAAVGQLRTQADQLAEHLRARQAEIDHREAQLNARIAQLERDTRAARLWLSEHESELTSRDEELTRRQNELEQRSIAMAAAEAAQRGGAEAEQFFQQREERLQGWAGELAAQEAELGTARQRFEADRRRSEAARQYEGQRMESQREALQQLNRQLLAGVERHRKAVEAKAAELLRKASQASPELIAREELVRRSSESLQAKQRQLEQAESRLADALAETHQLHRQLQDARRDVLDQGRVERQKLAAEHRRAVAELQKQREAVERRSDHVDQCRKALQQLRVELGRMHRETLEIRLATEELWVQLSGAAPPAALTRSLGRIRSKLADHYRQANADLHEQKKDLEQIRDQLLDQHEKLLAQKQQLEGLSAVRREETEQQAARLVAREQQLLRHQTDLEDQIHDWQAERMEYQQEICRLKAQLAQRNQTPMPV